MKTLKSTLFLILYVIILCNSVFSQNCFTPKRAGGVDGIHVEEGTGVATDTQGNVYVIGNFESASITFGTQTITKDASNQYAFFIVKYNASGTVLWAKSVNAIQYQSYGPLVYGHTITIDNSGGILVCGSFFGSSATFGSITTNSTNGRANFIVKYDNSGNTVWVKSNSFRGYYKSISTDVNGNVMATGGFKGSIIFGSTTLTNPDVTETYSDVFIVKFNSSGTALWAKNAGATYDDDGNCVASDLQGNIYLIGRYNGSSITFGSITLPDHAGSGNSFIVKYDGSGNVIWAKRMYSTVSGASIWGNSVIIDVNGDIFINGQASNSLTFETTNFNNVIGSFLLKINNAGSSIWGIRTLGAGYNVNNTARTLSTNSLGDVYLIYDNELKKYSGVGNLLWAKNIISSGFTNVLSLSTDLNDNTYITGGFNSNLIIGNTTLTSGGNKDIFIARSFDLMYINSTKTCKGSNTGTASVQMALGIGNFNYLWSNGQTTPIATGLSEGNYTLTVTDNNNCTVNKTVTILPYSTQQLSITTSHLDETCIGGGNNATATGNVQGGTPPYTYAWNTTPIQTTQNASNLSAGSYNFIVTDAYGCTKNSIVQVNYTPNPSSFSYTTNGFVVSFSKNGNSCNTFVWDFGNGNTSTINPNPIVTYLTAGTYGVCLQCNDQPTECIQCLNITVPSNTSGGTTTGIEEVQLISDIKVYPNPTNDFITIENENFKFSSTYTILNSKGQSVLTGYLTGATTTIDVNILSSGIYLLQVGETEKHLFKLIRK